MEEDQSLLVILGSYLPEGSYTTLCVLNKSFLDEMSVVDKSNNFWLRRIENVFGIKVPEDMWNRVNWKWMFYELSEKKSDEKIWKKSNLDEIRLRMQFGLDPSVDNNRAIQLACISRRKDLVQFLLKDPRVNPATNNNYPIRASSREDYTEIVKLLLADPRVNPAADNNNAVVSAAIHGHAEVVKLLLTDPRVDSSVNNNQAIIQASLNGHTNVVRLLLTDPRVDPSDNNNKALSYAAYHRKMDIIRILISDDRVIRSLGDQVQYYRRMVGLAD